MAVGVVAGLTGVEVVAGAVIAGSARVQATGAWFFA